MTGTVVVEPRYHGYPRVAHGGYVSGVVAELVGEPAQVTLRASPPLGRPLEVRRSERGSVLLVHHEKVVAKGVPSRLEVVVPAPPTIDEAAEATTLFPAARSPSPTCLCCGHRRREGEGLRILPGPIAGREVVAAPWIPHRAFGDGEATVRPEFVWASLDCPGAWGLRLRYPEGARRLTVRLTARLLRPIPIGEPHVVIGWPIGHRRRLFDCGAAVFGARGDLRAFAVAMWMAPS